MTNDNQTKVTACESEQPLVEEAINGEMELTEGNLIDLWNDIMYG